MKALQKYKDRIELLILLANKKLSTARYPEPVGIATVNRELFNELRTSSLSFIKNLCGEGHPYYTDFDQRAESAELFETQSALGILNAIKVEIREGWLIALKGPVFISSNLTFMV